MKDLTKAYVNESIYSVCSRCDRAIDLHHPINEKEDGSYEHLSCFIFAQYDKLVNIAYGLIDAIERDEVIDVDQLRDDLLDATEGLRE